VDDARRANVGRDRVAVAGGRGCFVGDGRQPVRFEEASRSRDAGRRRRRGLAARRQCPHEEAGGRSLQPVITRALR
jgi:hypothetical protein